MFFCHYNIMERIHLCNECVKNCDIKRIIELCTQIKCQYYCSHEYEKDKRENDKAYEKLCATILY